MYLVTRDLLCITQDMLRQAIALSIAALKYENHQWDYYHGEPFNFDKNEESILALETVSNEIQKTTSEIQKTIMDIKISLCFIGILNVPKTLTAEEDK
ncbi:hypothetical protein L0244_38655 [bacterium]|nr:hypothetical protein [bacterium]